MPISKPHSSLGADKKGSCSNLATYLQKENEEIEKMMVRRITEIAIAFSLFLLFMVVKCLAILAEASFKLMCFNPMS